jgi:hypothetical protein
MATKKKASRPKPKSKPKAKAKARPKKRAAPKPPSQEEMMAMWHKAATPAEGHRRLEPTVGSFRTKTTFTMMPGEPPQTSEGVSEHRWVLGGRYVEQLYKGSSMGMPFEGIGFTGYDNVRKMYVGTWMDSFGTGFMHSVGVGRPKDNEIKFESESMEPSGKRVFFESVVRVQDHDRHSYEMWTKAPNGKRYRMMLVEYARI